MIIEQKIAAILATVPGCKFYPVQYPDPDGTIPDVFGIYTKIGGVCLNTLVGDISMSRPRIQISIYAISYATLKTLELAVTNAFLNANNLMSAAINAGQDPMTAAGALPNISSSVPTDGFEPDTRRYYLHMDYYAWVNE